MKITKILLLICFVLSIDCYAQTWTYEGGRIVKQGQVWMEYVNTNAYPTDKFTQNTEDQNFYYLTCNSNKKQFAIPKGGGPGYILNHGKYETFINRFTGRTLIFNAPTNFSSQYNNSYNTNTSASVPGSGTEGRLLAGMFEKQITTTDKKYYAIYEKCSTCNGTGKSPYTWDNGSNCILCNSTFSYPESRLPGYIVVGIHFGLKDINIAEHAKRDYQKYINLKDGSYDPLLKKYVKHIFFRGESYDYFHFDVAYKDNENTSASNLF